MYGNFKYGKDRFGFAAPFLLGALTGGVAVGAFNPYRPRPVYYQNQELWKIQNLKTKIYVENVVESVVRNVAVTIAQIIFKI